MEKLTDEELERIGRLLQDKKHENIDLMNRFKEGSKDYNYFLEQNTFIVKIWCKLERMKEV
jgi:hypothetical protein